MKPQPSLEFSNVPTNKFRSAIPRSPTMKAIPNYSLRSVLQRGVEITSDYPIVYIIYIYLQRFIHPNGGCLGFLPSTVAPENRPGPQKEKIVFQPSIFRAELGVGFRECNGDTNCESSLESLLDINASGSTGSSNRGTPLCCVTCLVK